MAEKAPRPTEQCDREPEARRLRVESRWLGGSRSRSTVVRSGSSDDDAPLVGDAPVLEAEELAGPGGSGSAVSPAETLLHALAACVTAALARAAEARDVQLTAVASATSGTLGLRPGDGGFAHWGPEGIRLSVELAGNAPPEILRELMNDAAAGSVVLAALSGGVPVALDVTIA